MGPVFPGGHRQRPVAGSQGASPTQSQSCWHPSPYVPALQPADSGETHRTLREPAPQHPTRVQRRQQRTRYLSGSDRPGAQGGTGSGRWPGHSLLRARSRSAPGSRLRGSPGDSLGWSRVESSLKQGWVELGLSCSKASSAQQREAASLFL